MRVGLLCLIIACSAGASLAQDPQGEHDPLVTFQAEAAEYAFFDLQSSKEFEFQSQPLLRWSNPARNGEDGAVFLWTANKVPAVIGTCFTYNYQNQVRRKHAFHAVTEKPIQGRHRGDVIWTPPEESVVMSELGGAPAPAAGATQRTIQMRNLARRFRVQATLREGLEQCRFIPQPLYRYESDGDDAVSGAMFAFSIGTDPEALLLLESRGDKDGKRTWYHGFARFSYYKLEAFRDNQPIWTVEQSENLTQSIFSRSDYQRLPYITFRAEHVLDR